MRQFTVPQFIDVEDKIIGPITTRQFIILLVAFIICGVSFKVFDFSLFLTISILVVVIFGIFAFGKINGRPFHFFVLNLIQTFKRPGLRVWNHHNKGGEFQIDELPVFKNKFFKTKAQPSKSKLSQLSLVVDTKGTYQEVDMDTEIKIS